VTTKKDPPKGNPFAGLAGLRDQLPAGPAPARATMPREGNAPAGASAAPKAPARAVVRLERKGRAGKETTIVEHLDVPAAELEGWCQFLKRSLGCGGVVEGAAIVLQGDLRSRIEPLLTARGVRKVTISGK